MRIAENKRLLKDIKQNNPQWFSRGNKRFFGDIEYKAYYSGKGDRYLVRATFGWSDMFGEKPTKFYKVNPIADDYEIQSMLEQEWETLGEVKEWLRNN